MDANQLSDNATVSQVEPHYLDSPSIKISLFIAYVLVFLCCTLGNILILVVIAMQKSMRTVTNFFLANLAVADLLVGIFCVVQNAIHFSIMAHGHWPFGPVMCRLYVYILHLVPCASAGILVLLSIQRFIAVLRPMLVQHLLTKVLLISSTTIVWVLSALTNAPYGYYVNYMEWRDITRNITFAGCLRTGSNYELKISHTVNFLVWYALPLCMLLVIYMSIGYVLIKRPSETVVARCRKRVIRLVVVIVLAFAILSCPRYIYLMRNVYGETHALRCIHCMATVIQPITFLLLFLNSGINPFLYAFLSERFRKAIKETFRCRRERDTRRNLAIQMSGSIRHTTNSCVDKDNSMAETTVA